MKFEIYLKYKVDIESRNGMNTKIVINFTNILYRFVVEKMIDNSFLSQQVLFFFF